MNVWYEIMDTGSANMVGDWPTEDEALRFVARYIEQYGAKARKAVTHWAFARDGERDEDFLLIAEGDALAERAMHAVAGAAD